MKETLTYDNSIAAPDVASNDSIFSLPQAMKAIRESGLPVYTRELALHTGRYGIG